MPSSSASATSLRRASALAYDVRGDGRMKLYGSWGRYFDWTKYELARGSFGGDFWRVYYRSLDTLDIASLSLNNKPGRDLWGSATGFRNRRVNFAGNVDPDIKPMSQDSTSVGVEYQLWRNTVFGVHYVHNDLRRTIEDIGALDANGDEAYVIGNPGEFLSEFEAPSGGLTPLGQPMPKAKRQYDAIEFSLARRFSNRWFFSGNYTVQPALRQLPRDRRAPTKSGRRRPTSLRRRPSSSSGTYSARVATPTVRGTSTI